MFDKKIHCKLDNSYQNKDICCFLGAEASALLFYVVGHHLVDFFLEDLFFKRFDYVLADLALDGLDNRLLIIGSGYHDKREVGQFGV